MVVEQRRNRCGCVVCWGSVACGSGWMTAPVRKGAPAMPHEQMDEQQIASYLRMDAREVVKLSARGKIPCRKVRGRFVYTKGQIDDWVESQMPHLDKRRLEGIEKGVSAHHGFEHDELFVKSLIPEDGISVYLSAKTAHAVLRALVELTEKPDLVYSPAKLIEEIRQRESLCSTALIPGVAFPHPHSPLPYDIAASFIVVGLTAGGIPFGAEDGSLTRLFFLICCKDERTHLHVLARLGRMLHSQPQVDRLLGCETSEELGESLLQLERSVLGG